MLRDFENFYAYIFKLSRYIGMDGYIPNKFDWIDNYQRPFLTLNWHATFFPFPCLWLIWLSCQLVFKDFFSISFSFPPSFMISKIGLVVASKHNKLLFLCLLNYWFALNAFYSIVVPQQLYKMATYLLGLLSSYMLYHI